MYFIQGVMSGSVSFVPNSLPPGLYQQAGGIANTPSVRSHATGTSGSFSPVRGGFAPQLTGQSPMLQTHNTGTPFATSALQPQHSGFPQMNGHSNDWDVTPAEKASADRFFDSLDTLKRGYIEGDIAVPFMLKSQLPGETLAQVWDLADINNDGRLTRDGFAIAMHLIQKNLAGQDIPATLPPSLVPPSRRSAALAQSPFSPAPSHTQAQPEADLFSFDAFDDPPPAVQTHSTGSNMLKPQTTGNAANVFSKPPIPQRSPAPRDPFSGSSPNLDLLGDDGNDALPTSQLHDRSAEIGNVRNHLQSTEKSLSNAKQERQALEQILADQASQLSTLQTQLSSAKAAYETETSLLNTLKERRTTQLSDIQKTREELIRAESDLSAVRVEKSDIEGAFLRDKEDARDLHRKMIEAGQQAEALKQDVEKLKKEAKQQKGLLAIARKQLSTKELERTKAQKDHEESLAEVTSLNEEKNAIEENLAMLESSPAPRSFSPEILSSPADSLAFAAAQPLPVTPDPSQPVRNNSNNPFERLAMVSGSSTPRSQSPFIGLQHTIVSSPPLSINGPTPFDHLPQPTDEETQTTVKSEQAASENPPASHLDGLEPLTTTPDGIFSPSTDHFVTPPSSAVPQDKDDNASVSKFPPLEDLTTPPLTGPPEPSQPSTDLGSGLKELEVEESDSSGDDSEDDVPLATLPAAKRMSTLIPNGKPNDTPKEDSAPSTTLAPLQLAPADVSFDDIFGDEPASQPNPAQGQKLNGSESAQPVDSEKKVEDAPHVAGVNEFDQTFSKLTLPASTQQTSFSFDNAFEDNFDFASAKVDFPAPATTSDSTVPVERKEPSASTFEDIFGASSTTSAASAPTQTSSGPGSQITNGHGLDSSFDMIGSKLDNSVSSIPKADQPITPSAAPTQSAITEVSVPPPSQSTHTRDSNEESIPGAFHIRSSPVSSPTRSETKSSLSKRGKTPPPARVASPKPRISSSSSKETSDKKDPPPRHSKISLRLPFGKKKKQTQEPMPSASSQLLTPPIEEPGRARSPAAGDDVEPVKQLTAMGFSRGQAVEALEKFDYDVPRALNSLLGAR